MWQPIELAPKNGTRILTYNKSWVHKVSTHYWWRNSWIGGPYDNVLTFPEEKSAPTHWMPFEEPQP